MNQNIEIEKKYLVEMPNIQMFVGQIHPTVQIIEQMYLIAERGERRIRRVIAPYGDGDYMYRYFYTEKLPADETGFKRIENETSINYHTYHDMLKEVDSSLQKICKTRYKFYIGKQLYELDVYDFETRFAILEVELEAEDTEFIWPQCLVQVADVTEDKRFKNRALASTLRFPDTDITK